jgi:hypothetical protein
MLVYEGVDGDHKHLVALDSIAFLSVKGLMGSGLAAGGVSRDPISFLNLLQSAFRERKKIGLIIINPLGEVTDTYLSGLQGGASGVFSFSSSPSDVGAPNSPNHKLVYTVFAMKPGARRDETNVDIILPHITLKKQGGN